VTPGRNSGRTPWCRLSQASEVCCLSQIRLLKVTAAFECEARLLAHVYARSTVVMLTRRWQTPLRHWLPCLDCICTLRARTAMAGMMSEGLRSLQVPEQGKEDISLGTVFGQTFQSDAHDNASDRARQDKIASPPLQSAFEVPKHKQVALRAKYLAIVPHACCKDLPVCAIMSNASLPDAHLPAVSAMLVGCRGLVYSC
jgi:hypothetical protein